MNKTTIYFNVEQHKYTNEIRLPYISATTIGGKYEPKFDDNKIQISRACERIGRNPKHPKYLKYKGMRASAILKKWDKARIKGCDRGNVIHDDLETNVKKATGFYSVFKSKYDSSNDRVLLYTVEDILENPNSGYLDLDYFIKTGIKEKYPKIFTIIKSFVDDGWRIYSEVAVFNNDYMISGLIDILFVKGMSFCILDWKTNKDPIKFEAGYWEKDINDVTTHYNYTNETFKFPINQLPYSVGNKYSIQLSMYNYLTIQFGFKFVANILCHITHDNYTLNHKDVQENPSWLGKTRVEILPIEYKETEICSIINDYHGNRASMQSSMFN